MGVMRGIPLYLQVKETIKKQIENETYPHGTLIPAEPELEKMFHVSRITIRQAISELVKEHYVKKERGIGTTVTYDAKFHEEATAIRSFTDEVLMRGKVPGTSYIDVQKIKATPDVLEGMYLSEDELELIKLTRVRTADDKPMVYFITYIPACFGLPMDKESYRGSMYDLFEEYRVGRPVRVKETVSAIAADDNMASWLKIKPGDPIFKRIRLAFDQNNRPIEFTISYYNGKLYEYSTEIHE